MQQNNKKLICRICGKPLQSKKCSKCGGTGFVSHFFFWEKECYSCNGSGRRFRCPDEYKVDHPLFAKVDLKMKYTPLIKAKIDSSSKQICPTCGGTGWTYVYGLKAPCPNCRSNENRSWRNTNLPPPPGHTWWGNR